MFTLCVLSLFLLLGPVEVWRSRALGAGGAPGQGQHSGVVGKEGPHSAPGSGAEHGLWCW